MTTMFSWLKSLFRSKFLPASNIAGKSLSELLGSEWRSVPNDPNDKEGWEWYWEGHLQAKEPHDLFFYFEIAGILTPYAIQLGLRNILCAGNGISPEPYALAAAGFHVTAIDLSHLATEYIKNFNFQQEHLMQFFPDHIPTGPEGSICFLCGDFRDEVLCPGPYDIILSRRTLQLFPEIERFKALESLERRLSPKGVMICHDHNSPFATQKWFASRNYDISYGWHSDHLVREDGGPFLTARSGKRAVWIIESSG